MLYAIPFPTIDPVAIAIGPLAIRWYALAYIFGIILGWRYLIRLNHQSGRIMSRQDVDDLIVWVTLGIIGGGRLGYVLFYKPGFYLENPQQILFVWEGGMSFHGGLLGVIVAILLFASRRKIAMLALGDMIACAAPIGLFLGRIANFVNGELYGRPADVPWAMVFPHGGPSPRHPSQLYEATLEGIILFLLLFVLFRIARIRTRHGALSGVFLLSYAVARSMAELFREPDAFLGYLLGGLTMGQLLSTPMAIAGLTLMIRAVLRGSVKSA